MRHLLLLIVTLIPLAAGCVSDRSVIAQAEQAHTQIAPAVITDPTLDAYTQTIGDRVVAAAKRMHRNGDLPGAEDWMFEDVQFHLVNSPTVNAFTTGGKHVYMYTGLLNQSLTEDGFAAVVGHEFGHIIGRHVSSSMARQYTSLGLAALAAGGAALASDEENRLRNAGIAGGAGLAVGQIAGLKFGRDDETEADELGFEFYIRSGYHPDDFGEFFRNMVEAGHDVQGFQAFLSSHPALSSRVANADRMAAEYKAAVPNWQNYLRPDVANERQFEQLKLRAVEMEKTAPQDTTLGQAQKILAAFPRCVDVDSAERAQRRGSNRSMVGASAPSCCHSSSSGIVAAWPSANAQ
ncbi:MAG: M48 family metalloprotease [Planctomycetota bacterium]